MKTAKDLKLANLAGTAEESGALFAAQPTEAGLRLDYQQEGLR